MLVKSERYTDENGVERQKDYFGPDKDTITSTVDCPVPQEISYPEETVEPEISGEEIQAQILLNQADIIAKQQEQDEVLAAILLNQVKGGEVDV